jgi:hypothetical protein
MHIDEIIIAIPIIVGLVGVSLAILERGYKRFLDARKEDPTLKWDSSYLINILVSSGGSAAIIAGVIPALTEQLGDVTAPITVISVIGNFALGYLLTYRVLDGLNNATERKTELGVLKEENRKEAAAALKEANTNN